VRFDLLSVQVALALGKEPNEEVAQKLACLNSFVPLLCLLDPRRIGQDVVVKIKVLLGDNERGEVEPVGGYGFDDNEAVRAIHDLLRQLVYVDPNANMLANGVRPLVGGPRLSLHSSRVTALEFPMYVRGEDDSVVSSRGKLALRDAASGSNPFFDGGVLKYYAKAGGAAPPTPWSSRKVIAAAVWYVCACEWGSCKAEPVHEVLMAGMDYGNDVFPVANVSVTHRITCACRFFLQV
jgi:hypothetical protein